MDRSPLEPAVETQRDHSLNLKLLGAEVAEPAERPHSEAIWSA